jgi:hypothetical protein
MEAAMLEVSASGSRGRLRAFVDEVVRPLPHVRQRENTLLYVRGLIEHGGRKSVQPTLFRLGEGAARYESVQQFLADSPWEQALLVKACAERVAPEIGVVAWVVDDTGIPKDGKHSPGVKRQYSGTLGKIGNCQIAVSLHAVGERSTLPLGGAACPKSGARTRSGEGRRRSPRASSSRRSRNSRAHWSGRPPLGRFRRRRSWPTAHTATTAASARDCTGSSWSTLPPSPRRSASTGRRRPSQCPGARARLESRFLVCAVCGNVLRDAGLGAARIAALRPSRLAFSGSGPAGGGFGGEGSGGVGRSVFGSNGVITVPGESSSMRIMARSLLHLVRSLKP